MGMRLYSLKIGDKKFKVAAVSTEEDMKKGLSGSKKLKKGYGMLFDFKESRTAIMNMKDMKYDLDMLFINSDMEVIRAVTITKDAKDIYTPNTKYVLEINAGEGKGTMREKIEPCDGLQKILSNEHVEKEEHEEKHEHHKESSMNIIIKIDTVPASMKERFKKGGTIDMIEKDVKADHKKMQVLDDEGKILMNIAGGERIFSIKHTEALVEMAEKIERGEATEKELGELMTEIITTQDTQKPEYV